MNNIKIAQKFSELKVELKSFAMYLARDKHVAEDLFQDTAVRVFRNVDKYNDDINFKAWVMVIMRNTFINHYRKIKRRRKVYDINVDTSLMNSTTNAVENKGEEHFALTDIKRAIEGLNETLREPFVMLYEGYKYEEIATHMDMPVGTIKSRIYQARKQLKEKLSILYKERSPQLTAA